MTAGPQSAPAPWNLRLAGAAIAGAALLAYANTLSAPFVFDDSNAIINNPSIRHLWPLIEVLSPPVSGGSATARPLVNLSFALNYAFGGERVEGYHVVNILIHALAGLALFGFVRRTLLLPRLHARWGQAALPVAFFTALLWTVHPLLTESVSCVVQRTESLAGLWYLVMFYCLARAAEPGSPARWSVGAFTACLLGMCTKEVMVGAPVLAVFFHVLLVDGSWREAWTRRGKFFVLLALTWVPLAWLAAHSGQRFGSAGFGLGVSPWDYALTQCRAILLYLQLAFWPHPLVLDYGDAVARSLAEVWPQAVALAVLLVATAAACWRKLPIAFAGLWFFAILAPSSSFMPLITQTIAEHRMYLPLAAVIVLVVGGLHTLMGRRSPMLFSALAVALLVATVRHNEIYRTALGLWTETAARAPENARAHNNLANLLDEGAQPAEAQREYERALALKPDYALAHFNFGNLLAAQDRMPEAIAQYEEAVRLQPDLAGAHLNLGNAYVRQHRWNEARTEFEAALKLSPNDPSLHNNLGGVLFSLGRPQEAVPHYEIAVRERPDPTTHFNFGTVLAAAGRIPAAIEQFQNAVRLDPANAAAHYRLGVLLGRTGRTAEAVAELSATLRLRPDYPSAREMLEQLKPVQP